MLLDDFQEKRCLGDHGNSRQPEQDNTSADSPLVEDEKTEIFVLGQQDGAGCLGPAKDFLIVNPRRNLQDVQHLVSVLPQSTDYDRRDVLVSDELQAAVFPIG